MKQIVLLLLCGCAWPVLAAKPAALWCQHEFLDETPPQNPWIKIVGDLNAGGGLRWKRQVIATTGSHDIVAADMDGDGRPDLLGANHGGPFQPVELWLNRGK